MVEPKKYLCGHLCGHCDQIGTGPVLWVHEISTHTGLTFELRDLETRKPIEKDLHDIAFG